MIHDKKYYQKIDFIRVLACFAILFYHLNLLKGGYLAVCSFFVLSGYLSCTSAFQKEKFSFFDYYKKRFLKIYFPLIIVLFLTLFVISFFSNLSWINLKPETTSVLFGYNNFWQLNANLDYFTRQVNSPFTHFWYLSILIQFDLIFPFLFLLFRKIGDKFNKIFPCIISIFLSFLFSIIFYQSSLNENIMYSYYHTLTRIFSLLFGLSVGFIHSYYDSLILKKFKKEPINKIVFYTYFVILIVLFFFVDSSSSFFACSMILVSIITCRLIDYSTTFEKKENLKIISFFSNISYEIYLVQYPVIYFFQGIPINSYLKIPCMILVIIFLSYFLNLFWHYQNEKYKIAKYSIGIMILSTCFYGLFYYFLAKDYTMEMKQLENQLSQNEIILKEKQDEYIIRLKEEENKWQEVLNEIDVDEDKLRDTITNLKVVGVGDSVMLGAVENLYQTFPNGYFDARVSRTAWVVNDILKDLKNKNMLSDSIILNLGANGDCSEACKQDIMATCDGKEVFWVNVTNDKDTHVNATLDHFATFYDNLHVIDWNSYSSGHSEYFVSDGIHLTGSGRKAYTTLIQETIYQVFSKKYQDKKEEMLKQHEEEVKSKISFYGNDILLNAFSNIQDSFSSAKFMINPDYTYETLKQEIIKSIEEKNLTHKIVFAFDKNLSLSTKEYQELVDLCSDQEIYILDMNGSINVSNAIVFPFYQEIQIHSSYLMIDEIHLTEEGNQALLKLFEINLLK